MCNRAWNRAWTVTSLVALLAACSDPVTPPPAGTPTADVTIGGDVPKLDAQGGDATKADGDATTGTDQDSVTPGDTASTDDTATGTDQDTTTPPEDTGTDPDATPTGCKIDDDCTKGATVAACKQAFCDNGQCSVKDAADGGTCDDGDACTEKDACAAGACTGSAKVCDDSNACTDDTCDVAAGCKNTDNTATCDDKDGCTTDDACAAGKCAGAAKKCDDGIACTDDSCAAGECVAKNNTANCEDGNACTDKDKCDGGACVGGGAKVCDDGNPCTADSCDVTAGCKTVDVTECSDGDACTVGDTCTGGKCTGTALVCDDKNPCTKDSCDKALACQNVNDDAATCDDGNSCTKKDVCETGKCVGKDGTVCNDSNPCTDDSCADGKCDFKPNTAPCDDKDACTEGDVCAGSACGGGKPIPCDDKNPCTTDVCDKASGTCKTENNTSVCDDNDKCTDVSACAGGVCTGTAKVCDDKNSCTTDSCDAATGSCKTEKAVDGAGCDDGSACTQKDVCTAGACAGAKLTCDDGNPCTDDACDAAKGCTTKANTAKCDDGNACTTGDVCKESACLAGTAATVCDDKNPCTTDTCDKAKGCVHANNTAPCNDADACTDADACKNGACDGKPKVCNDNLLCTDDACDKVKGCVTTNNTAPCSDGSVCTPEDKCAAGKCVGGAAIKCDDGNACTTDTCDAKLGCQFKALADKSPCDDGNGCTTADACAAGKCLGQGKSCDDTNPCTTDTCAANVCKNVANTNPCNDGDSCTQDDKCNATGKCVGANPLKCVDSNPCTDDKCVNQVGCTFPNNTVTCDDGQFCTVKEACKDGKCANGVPNTCDDANVCTNDFCSVFLKACGHTNNTAACEDGDKCTLGDVCANAKCAAGKPAVCNDSNPCTTDSCDKVSGKCVFTLTTGATACKLLPVPVVLPTDANDPLWFAVSTSTTVKWQTDATPAQPGKLTGAASLNFNNGANYKDGSAKVEGRATGVFQVDASKVTGTFLTLAFYSYQDVEPSEKHDDRMIEISTDGFNTLAKTVRLSNLVGSKAWRLEAIELNALVGKVFQVRFRFDSVDGVNNDGKGWFVDEGNVYAGPIAPVDALKAFTDAFGNNASGWQFSAAAVGAPQWAIDGTPAAPVAISAPTSLNFNNGTNYQTSPATTVAGAVLSPVIDLEKVTGDVTLLFKEWVDVETLNGVDKRFVQVSADAFTGAAAPVLNLQQSNGSDQMKGWRWNAVNLTAYKGKKVRVRFAFDSVDNQFNGGKGWFIDDMIVDTRPMPYLADMVTCASAAKWTISKVNNDTTSANWAVDATGITAFSPDCSLNFNRPASPHGYACTGNNKKVGGTASQTVVITKPVAGKATLTFRYYVDVEELGASLDSFRIVVKDNATFGALPTQTTDIPKAAAVKQWATFTHDLSGFHGKTVTLSFLFDSVDCVKNAGAGVAVDDVMIRVQ